MDYNELIAKALKGRSVNSVSKIWGVPQSTLNRWIRGDRLPDFDTAWRIANEAGVDPSEAFKTFAEEERTNKSRQFKLQSGFVQIELLAILATGGLYGLFILC
jgi:transcriptional regulator with XRE-family HTH domain